MINMDKSVQHLLEVIISDLRQDNTRQHREIICEIRRLNREVDSIRLWRSRIIGMSVAISSVISAAAWAAGQIWR